MDFLKSIDKITLIVCGSVAALGFLTMILPMPILYIVCFLIALGMVGVGVLRTRTYLNELKVSRFSKVPNLVIGIALIMGGILVVFESSLLIALVPILFCVVIWAGMAYLAQRGLEGFTRRKNNWWIQAALMGVTALLAIIVTTQLKGNLQYILGLHFVDQITDIAEAKEAFMKAMESSGSGLTMWFTGLSMILTSAGVLGSYILPGVLKK